VPEKESAMASAVVVERTATAVVCCGEVRSVYVTGGREDTYHDHGCCSLGLEHLVLVGTTVGCSDSFEARNGRY
jgi:hypothetical protein